MPTESPHFVVPKNHADVFIRLSDASDGEFRSLFNALAERELSIDRATLTRAMQAALPTWSRTDARTLLTALFTAELTRVGHEWGVSRLSEEIAKSIDFVREGEDEPPLDSDRRDRLVQRLTEILSAPQVAHIAKAMSLLMEHEHVYHDARVLTDVRMVFDEEGDNAVAALITQMLHLEYHDQDATRSLYLALEPRDIRRFIAALKRAETKAAALRRHLASTKIPVLEVGDASDADDDTVA